MEEPFVDEEEPMQVDAPEAESEGNGNVEQVEIRPNSDLINPHFDKYNLANLPGKVAKGGLKNNIKVVNPTDKQTSRQELKLFSVAQLLVVDMHFSNEEVYYFYYLATDNCIYKVEYDVESNSFSPSIKINLDRDFEPRHTDDHALPWSLKFISEDMAAIADGLGRMVLVKTGDRRNNTSWNIFESYHLLRNGTRLVQGSSQLNLQPFIITDTRDATGGVWDVVLTTVMKKSDYGSGVKRCEGAVATHIYWINFEQRTVGNNRIYLVDGDCEYSTLSNYFDEIIIVSSHQPRLIFDTGNPSEVRSDHGPEPAYTWSQTADKVIVDFDLHLTRGEEVDLNDVEVEFQPQHLSVKYKGEDLLRGELFDAVKVEECKYEVARIVGTLKVILTKANKVRFTQLIPDDHRGRFVLVEVAPNLPNVTTLNVANPDQLEDIDIPDEHGERVITWSKNSITKTAYLSNHKILYTSQYAVNQPIGFAFRYDVDAVFFDFEEEVPRHRYTVNAFGYVVASKKTRRFTVASPNGKFAAVVENQNYALIYADKVPQSPGTSLINTKTKKTADVACQYVVSLTTVDPEYASMKQSLDIVAAVPTNKVLFIATDWAIYGAPIF